MTAFRAAVCDPDGTSRDPGGELCDLDGESCDQTRSWISTRSKERYVNLFLPLSLYIYIIYDEKIEEGGGGMIAFKLTEQGRSKS